MKRARLAFAWLTLALGCASGGFPPQPPELRGAPKLWVPNFTTVKLKNGLTLHVNPDPYLPVVSIAIGVRGGYLLDPPEKAGLAEFFADNLVTRSERMDRLALAGTYDVVGAPVVPTVTAEGTLFTIEVLEDRSGGALKLMGELLTKPGFDPENLERLRLQQRSSLDDGFGNPSTTAMWGLRQVLFGPRHPMGLPTLGTRSSIAGFKLGDLEARARLMLRPDHTVVVVSGRVLPDVVAQVTEHVFGAWSNPAGPPVPVATLMANLAPVPKAEKRKAVHYLPQAGASQTTVMIGRIGLPIGDPRFHHLRMVAGRPPAGASSWLRGQEQVTYGVSYLADANTRVGYFGAHLTVDTPATGMALESLLGRYAARLEGDVDIEKVVLLSNEGQAFYTLGGRSRAIARQFVLGQPLDHFAQLRQAIDDLRPLNVEPITDDFIDDDYMHVVLVGDQGALQAQIPGAGAGPLVPLELAALK